MQRKINDVIVVGAGPAGLFAARRLAKNGMHVTVLEKESHVGGKCYTYSDPDHPEVKTEWGAVMVAPNYGVVLDAIQEKNIEFEESLPTDHSTVNIIQKFQSLDWMGKIGLAATFAVELARFTYETSCYQYARTHLQSLPADYELPFATFSEKYHMENINLFLKSFVTAFGYGLMDEIPAYCVMEYMGVATLPVFLASPLRSGLVSIKDGMQTVMEKVAEDVEVVTSASITDIQRQYHEVTVTYRLPDQSVVTKKADALVLAVSPVQWSKLGMKMTDVEQHCADDVSYYPYPVAVCKVDGAKPQHIYIPHGLEKNGRGHAALFTTRDNRVTHQRLGTAYINLPPKDKEYTFNEANLAALATELKENIPAKEVEIVGHKIWEDYMPTLSWEDRLQLESEQMREGIETLYVGAYAVGGFEDVACVAEQSTTAVDKYILDAAPSTLENIKHAVNRAAFFYRQPRLPAVTDAVIQSSYIAENTANMIK